MRPHEAYMASFRVPILRWQAAPVTRLLYSQLHVQTAYRAAETADQMFPRVAPHLSKYVPPSCPLLSFGDDD